MSFDSEDDVSGYSVRSPSIPPRESSSPKVDYDGGETKGHAPKSRLVPRMMTKSNIDKAVEGNLSSFLPALMNAEAIVERVIRSIRPYARKAYKKYKEVLAVLEPYGLNEIFMCLSGFAMMFFGGFFVTTIAVWEAIKQGGLQDFKKSMKMVYDQFVSFKEANQEDDEEDLDGDGIADVKQIPPERYAVRKFLLALRSTDPEALSQGLHSLYTIFIAVVATLRLQFARTISLGASIGDQIEQVVEKFVLPVAEKMTDEAYHPWLDSVGTYVSRLIGVSIAFQIQRILSTFHSAIKGARLFTKGVTKLSQRNNFEYLTDGILDEVLSFGLAVAGIYLQLFAWTEMPIIVKLLFFPAFFVESILSMFVNIAISAGVAE